VRHALAGAAIIDLIEHQCAAGKLNLRYVNCPLDGTIPYDFLHHIDKDCFNVDNIDDLLNISFTWT
jgi:hypothetical protein